MLFKLCTTRAYWRLGSKHSFVIIRSLLADKVTVAFIVILCRSTILYLSPLHQVEEIPLHNEQNRDSSQQQRYCNWVDSSGLELCTSFANKVGVESLTSIYYVCVDQTV